MSFDALVSGFLNPLTIPAHLLALAGLGLLIGIQPGGRLLPALAFVAGLAIGLTAIALAVGLTPALDLLLVTSVVIGAALAMGIALPRPVSAAIALICGVAIGLDSPPQAISLADATAALVGTGLAASLALAIVIAVASRLTHRWQHVGLRIIGSWIAASTILVLALRFARGMLFGM